MRILLINPFMDYTKMRKIFAIESQNPPLGLLYLASSLEKNEHKVEIIDFCCEKFTEEKLKKAIENIDAVGLTVRSYGVNSVSYIIDFIKKQNENIITIVGGPHCTLDPEKALVDTHADICVEGDGEIALAKIVGSLVRNEELSNIPGVFYKKDEKIIRGPPAEVIMDLDSLPYPNRDLVYKYSYGAVQNDIKLGKGKVTEIMISRGCPYNCRFCTNKAITKKYRTRSAENVIEEIKLISKKYDFLFILDDNFFVDMKKSLKILDAIIEEKLDLEMAIAGIRVDAVTDEMFMKMKKAGVTLIAFGIESGNQDVLDYYQKGTTIEQITKAVKLARKYNFMISGNFILGAPFETEQHFKKTIQFAKKLPLDMAVFAPLKYVKGSPLWLEAFNKGLVNEDEIFVTSDSARGLGSFPKLELENKCIKTFQDFYLRPRFILKQIFKAIVKRDYRLIKSGIKILIKPNNILTYKPPDKS